MRKHTIVFDWLGPNLQNLNLYIKNSRVWNHELRFLYSRFIGNTKERRLQQKWRIQARRNGKVWDWVTIEMMKSSTGAMLERLNTKYDGPIYEELLLVGLFKLIILHANKAFISFFNFFKTFSIREKSWLNNVGDEINS